MQNFADVDSGNQNDGGFKSIQPKELFLGFLLLSIDLYFIHFYFILLLFF